MKIGDLVRHKGWSSVYLVVALDSEAPAMIGILESTGTVRWVVYNWLEVVLSLIHI